MRPRSFRETLNPNLRSRNDASGWGETGPCRPGIEELGKTECPFATLTSSPSREAAALTGRTRRGREVAMPELPDVELYKRDLDATCLGRTIRRVTVSDVRILGDLSAAELGRRLEGARITASRRHGKHLLVDLGPPGWITMHFGMTGSLEHFIDGEPAPPY